MGSILGILKLIIDNGPLKGGALITALVEIFIRWYSTPVSQLACTLWIKEGRPRYRIFAQITYEVIKNPCANELGIVVDGFDPEPLYILLFLPFLLAALYLFIKENQKSSMGV